MKLVSEYSDFTRLKGRSLAEINPGSDGRALSVEDALQAIELLRSEQLPVLGGDILSIAYGGKLVYAYQLWGSEYHFLNWHYDRSENENYSEYCKRSYKTAQEYIQKSTNIAKKLGKLNYIVLVV
ncbi:MAG: Imm40 family immunity protein [Bacteroidota bacterium]